ncbi:MAG: helix-turn-helix domain-containing protein [Rhodospirillales bacterium]|nr:helix-turn-helix domain-containing protein [Rhodospirillales bacterium]
MSAADPVPPIAAGVGADLRAAREQAGWTLPQLAAHLRIRPAYLDALEEGRIGLLPGNAYAVAFMRSYASVLGLDPEEIVRRFRREAAQVNEREELQFPAPLPERGMPAGAIVVVGLVIAIGGYAIWWHGGGAPAPAPRVADIPAHLAALADASRKAPPAAPANGAGLQATADEAAAQPSAAAGPDTTSGPAGTASGPGAPPQIPPAFGPLPPAGQSAASPQAGSGSEAGLAASKPLGADRPAHASGAGQALASAATNAAAAAPAPPIPDISPASAAAAPPPTPPVVTLAPGVAGAPVGTNTVVLGATADAWLEVRDPTGQVLLNRVLHKGDSWTAPNQTGLILTTGNAGGTTVTVGKLVIPSLGGNGVVRRNLQLDPAAIRAGDLAANASPPNQGAPKTN